MIARKQISRRRLLQGGAAALTAAPFIGSFSTTARADQLVVGALYVGAKDDYGWNQAHALGVASLKSLPDVLIREEERVPETIEVQKSMESMINLDGAKLIFATSFGYWDHMLKVAADYPDVQFLHAAPTVWKEGMPVNAGSYNGFIDEAQYVSGVIAGHMSKSGKIGFVGAKPYPASLRNINAFNLGARSVNPNVTTHVIFTGDWVRAARLAGLSVTKYVLVACFIGGAGAGLAGMFEVAAGEGRVSSSIIVGYGYTGILVAFIARQNPLAIIPVAILLGGIRASGGLLQRWHDLPDASVLVLQGIMFVMILAGESLHGRISKRLQRRVT